MLIIMGVMILNLKILFAEKIQFLYTLLLPTIFFVLSSNQYIDESSTRSDVLMFFSFFWSFILIATVFNGIGVHLARLRNYGLLKTYTLIAGSKRPIILGVIGTQFIFSLLTVVVFTLFGAVMLSLPVVQMVLVASLLVCIAFTPLALISILITVLPVRESALGILVNILLYVLFFLFFNDVGSPAVDAVLKSVNPFHFLFILNQFLFQTFDLMEWSLTIYHVNGIGLLLLAVGGLFAYRKLSLVSQDYRT